MGCRVKNCDITCDYLALTLLILVVDMQTTKQSHTETYATYRSVTRQVCRTNSRQDCTGILFWTDCSTVYYCVYNTETVAESVISTRCQSGWSPYPNCNETNECTKGMSECDQICNDTVDSYTCSCNDGYRLAADGKSCDDIDECTAHIDNCGLLENFTCVNTVGGYRCVCKTGFELVGQRECRDINECETLTNNCTLYENTTCENTVGSYNCERPGLHDQSGSNISTQSGERPGLQGQSGSNRMSESTVTLIIVVTVCSVVGVVLIIIAVACIVTCAKKRKKNKGDSTTNSTELAAESVYEELEMTINSTDIESDSGKTDSKEAVTGKPTPTNNYKSVKRLLKSQKEEKSVQDETVPEDSIYQELDTVTTPNLPCEATRASSNDTSPVQGDASNAKTDYKETAKGHSTTTNVKKGVKGLFRSQKERRDFKIDKATTESIYQELSATAPTVDNSYEGIDNKSSNSIDISAQEESINDSSPTHAGASSTC